MTELEKENSMSLLLSLEKEIKGFLRAKSGNWDLAEDLYQDLTIKLIKSETFLKAENQRAFIYSAANNLIKDQYRKNVTREKYLDEARYETKDTVDLMDGERILSARMQIKALQSALNELPDLTRQIFRLVRVEGLKQRDVAEQFDVTLRTVERHLAKALAHCHKKLRN